MHQDYYINKDDDIILKINDINIQKMYDYKGMSLDGEATFMDKMQMIWSLVEYS